MKYQYGAFCYETLLFLERLLAVADSLPAKSTKDNVETNAALPPLVGVLGTRGPL